MKKSSAIITPDQLDALETHLATLREEVRVLRRFCVRFPQGPPYDPSIYDHPQWKRCRRLWRIADASARELLTRSRGTK